MRPLDHPSSLTPDQRFQELTGILAAGLLRLAPRAMSPSISATQNSQESAANCLDVPPNPRLSVHTG
jgi:hypothetical protein